MKKYQIIYADPPWSYTAKNPTCKIIKQPEKCSVEYYYPTMKLKNIQTLPIRNICEDDCILFLWATTPMIQEALETMKVWGFKYKTMITWEKTNKDCMGYWFRVCTEHLLVGIKGKTKSFRCMERTLHSEPRLGHSRKPDYFRKLIESVTEGNKIELFARQKVDGWDCWGNEVESDIALVSNSKGSQEANSPNISYQVMPSATPKSPSATSDNNNIMRNFSKRKNLKLP